MPTFDIYLNGRRLCRAGVGPDGVLSAIVSWTKLTGEPARQARRWKSPVEQTQLQVGGLRKGVHRDWLERKLRVGDQVMVAVRPAGRADAPARRKPSDSILTGTDFPATEFLNVDLDVWAAQPLDALAAAFGRRVIVHYAGKEGRQYSAHLCLARSGSKETADQLIGTFVGLIRRLPPRARRLWNRAKTRDFNIGIQAAAAPYAYLLPVESKTVRAAASVNARIVVTVYAPFRPVVRRRV